MESTPHYGTPGNPYDRRLIPGGSSSGAAVSAADGQAVVGIGTDTGGSVRIPAAFCAILDAIMAGEPPAVPAPIPFEALRLGVPQTYVLDGLAPEVAYAFAAACASLSSVGARLVDIPLTELTSLAAINTGGGFASIETYAWHQPLLARRGNEYDQRVRPRI